MGSPTILLPGSATYDEAATWPVIADDDRRPAAIALCANTSDVAWALDAARAQGLTVGIRAGGHSFAGHSRTDGVLIDLSPMNEVRLSGDVAVIGAGARLSHVYDELHRAGRTIPAGCGATVGIAGLALGGGIGILGRLHGLTCDALIGAQVVLADGSVLDCGPDREPDLFWTLRGAGSGNFGVVSSLMFATVPEPSGASFQLVWPHDLAGPLLSAWQRWLPTAPEAISPSLHLFAPADPGREPLLHLIGAALGTHMELLEEMVVAMPSAPTQHHGITGSLRAVKANLAQLGDELEHAMGAPPGRRIWAKSLFFREPLPDPMIENLVELTTAGRRPGECRELDLMPMGGAYNRVAPEASAFVHRDDLFLFKYASHSVDWLEAVTALIAPYATGRAYQNFADPLLADPLAAYYAQNLPRLVRLKQRYDPGGRFRHGQSIPLP